MSASAAAAMSGVASRPQAALLVVRRAFWSRLVLYSVLAVLAIIVLLPLYLMFLTSIMPAAEVSSYPPRFLTAHPTLSNFREVLRKTPMLRYVVNSLVAASTITLGQLCTACLAAYAFAFLEFPGRRWLFLLFLTTLMIPAEVTLIPNFLTINALGWRNTYAALTVPFVATAFGTFLLRQFFLSIPKELRDAARIDGCGHLRFLGQIVVPLARPALATLAAYGFLSAWNMYLWPLIVSDRAEMRTVQIGIRALENAESLDRGLVMAGAVIAIAPTVLLLTLAQRHLVRGLTAGAIKG